MSEETGGPAFPQVRIWNPERREYEDAMFSPGMTLRDWFAGQALAEVMSAYFEANGRCLGTEHFKTNCAKIAYDIADAMLKEREK